MKKHSRGGRRITRPTTHHVRGEDCACGRIKVVSIRDVIRFYQPYVWGSPEWERAYGARNLSETANSNFKDHHGRFAKGSIKVLGRNKIALALAFFVDAVNTRLIISMPTDFFERWTGPADPYLPEPDDPAWADPDHEPPATRAGPEGRDATTSPATLEPITTSPLDLPGPCPETGPDGGFSLSRAWRRRFATLHGLGVAPRGATTALQRRTPGPGDPGPGVLLTEMDYLMLNSLGVRRGT